MSNFSLKAYNTFRIDSSCKKVWAPLDIGELVETIESVENPIILGSGSNVLLSSNINQDVILTGGVDGLTFDGAKVNAKCGVKTMLLSKMAKEKGLSGFEFLIAIPASLGGAVLMNASAHGQTISDYLVSLDVYDIEKKEIVTFKKEEAEFRYRSSKFKSNPRYVVLGADFILSPLDKWEIRLRMDENIAFRKEKQPSLALPNAGSVFKNPPGDSAGRLLDECGLKGERIGDAKVWDGHANFIINVKNATSKDVSELMFSMYNRVKDKFGIELEPEIVFIGEKSEIERNIWNTLLKQK